jgi:hypothetical protein
LRKEIEDLEENVTKLEKEKRKHDLELELQMQREDSLRRTIDKSKLLIKKHLSDKVALAEEAGIKHVKIPMLSEKNLASQIFHPQSQNAIFDEYDQYSIDYKEGLGIGDKKIEMFTQKEIEKLEKEHKTALNEVKDKIEDFNKNTNIVQSCEPEIESINTNLAQLR